MTEILTESFCERCGTRYTFESTAPRKSRLGRMKVLSKGVRNFVMSDDASLSEALAEARSEEELAATASQLDAFHQTFNFCLTCRQYTCSDCWNGPEGRCLTCAPIPGQEEPAALIDLAPRVSVEPAPNGRAAGAVESPEAWPAIDLAGAADLEAAVAASLTSIEVPSEPAAHGPTSAQDQVAALLAVPPAGTESEAVGAEPESARAPDVAEAGVVPPPARRLAGIAPGESLDDAIAAYEAMLTDDETAVPTTDEAGAPTVAMAADLSAETPVVTGEPVAEAPHAAEKVVASPAAAEPAGIEPPLASPAAAEPAGIELPLASPQPVVAEPAATEPVPPTLPGIDRVAQPTWPVSPAPTSPDTPPEAPTAPPVQPVSPWLRVAPDETGSQQPAAPQPAAPQPAAPAWPATPQWPAPPARPEAPLTLAGRTLLPQADASALWAASAKEVLGPAPAPIAAAPSPTAQPCISCGLSLSANARFCRRCGSRQG